jgi:hypothetical protein
MHMLRTAAAAALHAVPHSVGLAPTKTNDVAVTARRIAAAGEDIP